MRRHRVLLALAAACGALGGCEAPPYAGSFHDYGTPYRPYAAPAYLPGYGARPAYRLEYGRPQYGHAEYGRPEYRQREHREREYDEREYREREGDRSDRERPDYAPPEYRQPGPGNPAYERRDDGRSELGPRTWR